MSRKKSVPARGRRIGRDAWLHAARRALIEGGINSVKIGRLAKDLGATRAAFYYQFENRAALLRDLLAHWRTTNTEPFYRAIEPDSKSSREKMSDIVNIWIDEKEYSPKFDAAVRDWARISPAVARTVKRIDQKRIDILKKIFLDLDFDEPDAFIRARIAYFHQIGYYVLGLDESKKRRFELAPLYTKALLGR